jgi:hypothetical protein
MGAAPLRRLFLPAPACVTMVAVRTSIRIGIALGVAVAVAAGCTDRPLAPVPNPDDSMVSPAASATISAPPSFVRPTPGPSPTFLVHVVRAGETLTSIARLYGTTARSIAYWNRERYPSLDPDSEGYDPNRIVVGWTLQVIPTEVVDEADLPEPTPTPSPGLTPSESGGSPAGSSAAPSSVPAASPASSGSRSPS